MSFCQFFIFHSLFFLLARSVFCIIYAWPQLTSPRAGVGNGWPAEPTCIGYTLQGGQKKGQKHLYRYPISSTYYIDIH